MGGKVTAQPVVAVVTTEHDCRFLDPPVQALTFLPERTSKEPDHPLHSFDRAYAAAELVPGSHVVS